MGRLIIVIAIVILVSLGMGGCQTNNRAKIVKVPIIICPVPEHSIDPVLPIYNLKEQDSGDWELIAKSYATSIVKLEAYIEKLKAKLDVYRSGNGEVIE